MPAATSKALVQSSPDAWRCEDIPENRERIHPPSLKTQSHRVEEKENRGAVMVQISKSEKTWWQCVGATVLLVTAATAATKGYSYIQAHQDPPNAITTAPMSVVSIPAPISKPAPQPPVVKVPEQPPSEIAQFLHPSIRPRIYHWTQETYTNSGERGSKYRGYDENGQLINYVVVHYGESNLYFEQYEISTAWLSDNQYVVTVRKFEPGWRNDLVHVDANKAGIDEYSNGETRYYFWKPNGTSYLQAAYDFNAFGKLDSKLMLARDASGCIKPQGATYNDQWINLMACNRDYLRVRLNLWTEFGQVQ